MKKGTYHIQLTQVVHGSRTSSTEVSIEVDSDSSKSPMSYEGEGGITFIWNTGRKLTYPWYNIVSVDRVP